MTPKLTKIREVEILSDGAYDDQPPALGLLLLGWLSAQLGTPAPGDFAEIVGTEKCMACHIAIKTGSPLIQKLARFHKAGGEVPWEPVYLIADYVFFNHGVHTEKVGAKCQDCHGPVEERDVLGKERDISMAACMDCHRARGGSLECNYCHDPR